MLGSQIYSTRLWLAPSWARRSEANWAESVCHAKQIKPSKKANDDATCWLDSVTVVLRVCVIIMKGLKNGNGIRAHATTPLVFCSSSEMSLRKNLHIPRSNSCITPRAAMMQGVSMFLGGRRLSSFHCEKTRSWSETRTSQSTERTSEYLHN